MPLVRVGQQHEASLLVHASQNSVAERTRTSSRRNRPITSPRSVATSDAITMRSLAPDWDAAPNAVHEPCHVSWSVTASTSMPSLTARRTSAPGVVMAVHE